MLTRSSAGCKVSDGDVRLLAVLKTLDLCFIHEGKRSKRIQTVFFSGHGLNVFCGQQSAILQATARFQLSLHAVPWPNKLLDCVSE